MSDKKTRDVLEWLRKESEWAQEQQRKLIEDFRKRMEAEKEKEPSKVRPKEYLS